ncbi:hypothetical protein B4U80_14460, partial [Leptotrombidium deliense]
LVGAAFAFNKDWDLDSIRAYHFHAYFFQHNNKSTAEALAFRHEVNQLIDSGYLGECTTTCRLCRFYRGPDGPHPIGNFLTCCNSSSIKPALDFFAKNRGSLPVLVHPLTEREIDDHTNRAMWIGHSLPLDESFLEEVLEPIDICDKDWPPNKDPHIVPTYFATTPSP